MHNKPAFPPIAHFDERQASRIRLATGILFIVLAIWNFVDPSDSMLSGRWSWLYRFVINTFGPFGWPVMQLLLGIVFLIWSKKRSS